VFVLDHIMKLLLIAGLLAIGASAANPAMARTVSIFVDAKNDSTNNFNSDGVIGPLGGHTGIFLALGDPFSLAVSGAWSIDAGGSFIGPEGTDAYGNICQPEGAAAKCGALVGRIGTGAYFSIGTGIASVAAEAGELILRNNDNDFLNNVGALTVRITYPDPDDNPRVPLPASGLLLLSGLAGAVAWRKRRQS
jgi:hypothetical protein